MKYYDRHFLHGLESGADLEFSSKNFRKFVDLFFRSTELIFRALPKHCLVPVLAKLSAPQAKFCKKKTGQKGVFRNFD